MIILGIDPATGASSPTGLAAIAPRTREIYWTKEVTTDQEATEHHKLYDLASQVKFAIDRLAEEPNFIVACETFVMAGKTGQLLQRLVGAYISHVEPQNHYEEIYNTAMKRLVAGIGSADKLDVALGCRFFFSSNANSAAYIDALIQNKAWDRTDAIGLALAAYIQLAYVRNNQKDIAACADFAAPARTKYINTERARLGVPRKVSKRKKVTA